MGIFINILKKDFFIRNKLRIFLTIFLILNAIKLVYFNYYLSIDIKNLPLFLISKFVINIVLVSAIFLNVFKNKHKKTAIFFYVFQFIYLLANICYFKYFSNYFHLFQFILLFGEGAKALSHLYFFLDFSIMFLFLDIPLFVYLIRNMKSDISFNISYSLYIFTGLSLCLAIYAGVYISYYIHMTSPKNSNYLIFPPTESHIVKYNGTLINEIISLTCSFGDDKIIMNLKYGKDIHNNSNAGKNPNIVILQMESIDSNVINKQHNGKYIAPYLHSLTKKCVYYPYTLSYHWGGGTSDAEFSIINSVEPIQFYPAMKLKSYNYPNSLIKQFRNNNYDCFAFHGNTGVYFDRDIAFPLMAFTEFYDMGKMHLRHIGWGAPDDKVFDFATNKIINNTNPILSYIITMTTHASFTSVYNYYSTDNYNDINEKLVKDYFTSVSYLDEKLEKFVTNIREQIPNTFILIWGDHTPSINKPEYSNSSMLYDGKCFEFVPLFIITPDDKVYKENSKVATFLDIAPTILNFSGIKYDYKTNGENLLDFGNINSKIPFKGSLYSRADLFKLISDSINK